MYIYILISLLTLESRKLSYESNSHILTRIEGILGRVMLAGVVGVTSIYSPCNVTSHHTFSLENRTNFGTAKFGTTSTYINPILDVVGCCGDVVCCCWVGCSTVRIQHIWGKTLFHPSRSPVVELVKLMAWRKAKSLMNIPVC